MMGKTGNRSRAWLNRLAACAALAGAASASIAGQPCHYSVEIVQHLCGAPNPNSPTFGQSISANGTVAGYYWDCVTDSDNSRSFIWPVGASMQTITLPTGTALMEALGLNDNGWIVGRMNLSNDTFSDLAFLYHDGQVINLGTLPGGTHSEANAIANDGTIVGWWGNLGTGIPTPSEAFRWTNGLMIGLGPILQTAASKAYDISENGLITGWVGDADNTDAHAFILNGSRVTILPVIEGGFTSEGRAINSSGNIAGYGRRQGPTGNTIFGAFVWINGQMITLGVLPGFTHSNAYGMNAHNQVVGGCSPGVHGFVWQDGVMTDLNDVIQTSIPSFTMRLARSINDAGQITGDATTQNGTVVVRLTPIAQFADLTGDCAVGPADLAQLLSQWGQCPGRLPCAADLNADAIVGPADLAQLLAHWG